MMSIAEHGVLQPLLVRLDGARVELVAGERRLRAARLAGLTRVPCTVTDGDPAILALVENLHRRDLSPLEEAQALASLQRERGLSLAELAAIAGKAKSTVSEILSLAKLPAPVRLAAAAQPEKFPQRLMVELAKMEPARAEELAQEVVVGGMTADILRAQRREAKPAPPKPRGPGESEAARTDALFRRAELLAGELLGVNVLALNYRQRAVARHSLQPMARALDGIFHHLKKMAHQDAKRWTPGLRASLLEMARRGVRPTEMAAELGREINEDGQPVHPSELAKQMILARQEAPASAEDERQPGAVE
jgi:ParB family chromosome partitioning protein